MMAKVSVYGGKANLKQSSKSKITAFRFYALSQERAVFLLFLPTHNSQLGAPKVKNAQNLVSGVTVVLLLVPSVRLAQSHVLVVIQPGLLYPDNVPLVTPNHTVVSSPQTWHTRAFQRLSRQ
jgi:hypothetical protein